jgi:UDP-N-acetylmuramoyl-tripeptide--D-alanyl-D-alanine ligase
MIWIETVVKGICFSFVLKVFGQDPVAVGGEARLYVEPAEKAGVEACFVLDSDAALSVVKQRVRPGDVVLVKASRGVRAERVVEGLVARGAA